MPQQDIAEQRPGPPPAAAPEPRQRWRAVFGRTAAAPSLPHREVVEALEHALTDSALPLLRDTRRGGRPRLTFGAPLPIGMVVDLEQFDLWLTELRPAGAVRAALVDALAPGYALHDVYDVWLGAAALPASVIGAEYRVVLDTAVGADEVAAAIASLLAAEVLPRQRDKGSGTVAYDLRPLLAGLELLGGDTPVLRIEVRFDPARGSGRPEEVVAAISEVLDRPLVAAETRRIRLIVDEAGG